MNLRGSLGLLTLVSCLSAACSSTNGSAEPADAGVDGEAPPLRDGGAPDGAPLDFVPARRLEVACTGEPCYVAVRGDGSDHICGLLKDGSVRCWGRDTRLPAETPPDGGSVQADGALGRGRVVSTLEGATPQPVVGLSGATQISVGKNLGTCARTEDGSAYCWGRNEYGQLGRPATDERLSVPTRIEGLPPISAIALGARTGCAVASTDGALWCWGATKTAIGRAVTTDDSVSFPPRVMPGFRRPVHELTIGTSRGYPSMPFEFEDTIIALVDDGVLTSLGESPAGESSRGGISFAPFELPGVARVGAFGYLRDDGAVAQWLPENGAIYVPMRTTVVDVTITAARGDFFSPMYVEQAGILLSSGRLFRWGRNTAGALGYPASELDVAEQPREMTHVAGDRVVSFATTAGSTCVSITDGKVRCWGTNQRGELGRGTIDAEEHPEAEVIR